MWELMSRPAYCPHIHPIPNVCIEWSGVGLQPVVVDGDSLLLEAVAHTAVDWKHGGQPLTVVFFVEKLLAQLRYALALGHSGEGADECVDFFTPETRKQQIWTG